MALQASYNPKCNLTYGMADEQKLYFVTFPQPINLLSVITTIFLGFIPLLSTVTQEKIRDIQGTRLVGN